MKKVSISIILLVAVKTLAHIVYAQTNSIRFLGKGNKNGKEKKRCRDIAMELAAAKDTIEELREQVKELTMGYLGVKS